MTDDKLREGEPEYGNAGQGVQELSPGRPAQASSFAEAMEDTSARPSSFEHVPIVTRGCDPAAAWAEFWSPFGVKRRERRERR